MRILQSLQEAHDFITVQKCKGKKIGLVPTMGALHQGHVSLVEASKKETDFTVCSIYVNPTQFNNKEDFKTYPNLFKQDIALLESLACDAVFAPSHESMYPKGNLKDLLQMNFGALEKELEGKYRPGHFNGVGVVVSKLLHIIAPYKAYFGQKDLQQYMIIKKMCRDLSFLTEIIMCPTVRETDGLAMSSRNLRLTEDERQVAPLLYRTLQEITSKLKNGEKAAEVKKWAYQKIAETDLFTPEYVEIVSLSSFDLMEDSIQEDVAACVSAHLGKARLIDNVIVSV